MAPTDSRLRPDQRAL